jgi:predicted MFS family arabinose efflux permease
VRPAVIGLRAATMQFGYFVGSLAAGTALAVFGYSALGATTGVLSLGAAVTLVRRGPSFERSRRPWRLLSLYRIRA